MNSTVSVIAPGSLRKALQLRGKTVTDFCAETGFSRATYSRLNNGIAGAAALSRLNAWLEQEPVLAGLQEVTS